MFCWSEDFPKAFAFSDACFERTLVIVSVCRASVLVVDAYRLLMWNYEMMVASRVQHVEHRFVSSVKYTMERRYIDLLDDDCWEHILKQLKQDCHDISSVSSVCKRFLSVTNRIKTTLRAKFLSPYQFGRLLQRFRHLKIIDIEETPKEVLDSLVLQILDSGLELEILRISFPKTPPRNALKKLRFSTRKLGLRLEAPGISFAKSPRKDIQKLSGNMKKADLGLEAPGNSFAKSPRNAIRRLSMNIKKSALGLLCKNIKESGLGLETQGISSSKTPLLHSIQVPSRNMKSPKEVIFKNVRFDDDLIAIADWFPCLEKLRIIGLFNSDYPTVTDAGIEVLAGKLKGLVMITLALFSKITDKSLKSLSSNCLNLKEIGIGLCPRLTENGIGFMIRNCTRLTCLRFLLCQASSLSEEKCPFTIRNSIPYARNLVEIQIWGVPVPDKVFCSIANSCPLLKKIVLVQTVAENNFTFHGLKTLVKSCPLLEHLELYVHWHTDEYMVGISDHLSTLTDMNISGKSEVTIFNYGKTFYIPTGKCPLLKIIDVDSKHNNFSQRKGHPIVKAHK